MSSRALRGRPRDSGARRRDAESHEVARLKMICIGAFHREYLVSTAPLRFYRPSGLDHLCKKNFRKVCPFCFRNRSSTPTTPQLKEGAVTKRSNWGSVMKIGLIGATLCLCLVGISHAQTAHASIRKTTNIPAEELGAALQTVAKDYDFQILYRTEIVKDLRTQGAVGSLSSDEVLTKVLSGTGLTYKYLDPSTVTIMQAPAGAADQSASDASNGGGKKSSQDFRVAQVDSRIELESGHCFRREPGANIPKRIQITRRQVSRRSSSPPKSVSNGYRTCRSQLALLDRARSKVSGRRPSTTLLEPFPGWSPFQTSIRIPPP